MPKIERTGDPQIQAQFNGVPPTTDAALRTHAAEPDQAPPPPTRSSSGNGMPPPGSGNYVPVPDVSVDIYRLYAEQLKDDIDANKELGVALEKMGFANLRKQEALAKEAKTATYSSADDHYSEDLTKGIATVGGAALGIAAGGMGAKSVAKSHATNKASNKVDTEVEKVKVQQDRATEKFQSESDHLNKRLDNAHDIQRNEAETLHLQQQKAQVEQSSGMTPEQREHYGRIHDAQLHSQDRHVQDLTRTRMAELEQQGAVNKQQQIQDIDGQIASKATERQRLGAEREHLRLQGKDRVGDDSPDGLTKHIQQKQTKHNRQIHATNRVIEGKKLGQASSQAESKLHGDMSQIWNSRAMAVGQLGGGVGGAAAAQDAQNATKNKADADFAGTQAQIASSSSQNYFGGYDNAMDSAKQMRQALHDYNDAMVQTQAKTANLV
ncbi:MAG TPA: hypothetical protein VHA82_14530 [Ramlibacter sp.]|uniref:hypothetical protein n=1 Tax=Ramlibacter sp. TaxID=1917967 RepID=UPI002D0CF5F0|nr:hypothetical protein [Ramlibacter sp.]HVZ45023.1 hypothetical protein [Ramlibacter sp.]